MARAKAMLLIGIVAAAAASGALVAWAWPAAEAPALAAVAPAEAAPAEEEDPPPAASTDDLDMPEALPGPPLTHFASAEPEEGEMPEPEGDLPPGSIVLTIGDTFEGGERKQGGFSIVDGGSDWDVAPSESWAAQEGDQSGSQGAWNEAPDSRAHHGSRRRPPVGGLHALDGGHDGGSRRGMGGAGDGGRGGARGGGGRGGCSR